MIDHVVVVVDDLTAARRALEALGFATTERGCHPRFRTSNHLAMLDDAYIELIAIDEPSEGTAYMRSFLDRGGGLCGIALATTDAADDVARLNALGIEVTAPVEFERPVTTPAGAGVARFRTARLLAPTGLDAYVFFCQHLTPELVWVEPAPRHPNGAWRITDVELPPGAASGRVAPEVLVPTAVEGVRPRGAAERGFAVAVRSLPDAGALRLAGFQSNRDGDRLRARHPALCNLTVELRLDS